MYEHGNLFHTASPNQLSNRVHYAELTSFGSPFVIHAGVESLTVTGADGDEVDFQFCAQCWLKNVEVTHWLGVGVNFISSYQSELRDSYVHDANWPVPGGGGYAIGTENASSEILLENNISLRANKVMEARASGAGTVVGYNYMDDGFIGSSAAEEPGTMAGAKSD